MEECSRAGHCSRPKGFSFKNKVLQEPVTIIEKGLVAAGMNGRRGRDEIMEAGVQRKSKALVFVIHYH